MYRCTLHTRCGAQTSYKLVNLPTGADPTNVAAISANLYFHNLLLFLLRAHTEHSFRQQTVARCTKQYCIERHVCETDSVLCDCSQNMRTFSNQFASDGMLIRFNLYKEGI